MYVRTRQEPLEHKPRLKHKFKSWLVLKCDICCKEFEIRFATERMDRKSHYCSRKCFAEGSKSIVQQNREATCLKKYGVKNSFASPEKQLTIRKTLMQRYGVDNPQKNADVRLRTSKTCIEKYGVPFAVRLSESSFISKIEKHITDMLEQIFGCVETQTQLNQRWFIDVFVPSHNTYVEIDGIHWHRIDSTTEQLMESNDLDGLQKRLRDLELNDWCAKHKIRLVRIDERTAHKITINELKSLVEECTGITSTY